MSDKRERHHYLFRCTTTNGLFVVVGATQKEATDYVRSRRMTGVCQGLDTRTANEQWDSQAIVYNA